MGIFGWSLPAGCNNINLPGEEDFDDSIPEDLVTEEQKEEISKLWWELEDFKKKNYLKTVKLEDLFGNNIPEGDFRWGEDADPGDGHAYECDCEQGWHIAYFNDIYGRENGKLFIEILEGDEDGNWDISYGWNEGEDSTEICNALAQRLDNYFIDWGKYWLYCAENTQEILEKGKDPLDQVIRLSQIKPEDLVEFFLNSARSNIEYLKM